MAHWAVVVPTERYEAERLFLHDTLELTGLDGPLPAAGDEVAMVAGEPEPIVFALGRVLTVGADTHDPDDPGADAPTTTLDIAYTHRLFDAPLPAEDLAGGAGAGAHPIAGAGAHPIAADRFAALADKARVEPTAQREWLVGVYLPIEAASPAEAVRAFWTHVQQLGPRELPAFVSPRGDELAMQAYVLGEVANQDPEEDDED